MALFSDDEKRDVEKGKKKLEVPPPDITIDDFHRRNVNTNNHSLSPLDILLTVVEVALEKYEEAKYKFKEADDVDYHGGDKELVFKQLLKESMKSSLIKLNASSCSKSKRKEYSGDEENEKPETKENVPELPQEFQDRMKELKCSKPVLLIQKPLTRTDVKPSQSRLSIPFGKVKIKNHNVFLNKEEMKIVSGNGSVTVKTFIGPSVEVSEMELKRWNLRKLSGKASPMYILRKHWNDVSKRHKLEEGDVVQVWAFKDAEDSLGLALVKVSSGGGDGIRRSEPPPTSSESNEEET